MSVRARKRICVAIAFTLALPLATPPIASACTRVIYETGKGTFLVGRTMDWYDDTGTDLWVFPRGMKRDGGVGPGSIEWTSKYGSLASDIYDVATAEGINEAGLVANILYLAEADYGDAAASGKPLLSVGAWTQYILDNFATVAEAVEALSAESFAIVAPPLPGGKPAGGHIAIADQTGDSAILECLAGKLVIHHGRDYTVMTNSPPFDEQLAIETYWRSVGGLEFLPGTHRASDRFARVKWNLDATPKVDDDRLATATVFSIIRNISVPLGITDPEKPNIASTLWRSVADAQAGRYYFEPSLNPSVFWVELAKLDLSDGAPVMRLDMSGSPILAGEVSGSFAPAEPFPWLTSH